MDQLAFWQTKRPLGAEAPSSALVAQKRPERPEPDDEPMPEDDPGLPPDDDEDADEPQPG